MKKVINDEDIQQVDFTGGVRGKHSVAYRRGHTVRVRHADESVTVQRFIPDADAVVIDRDVRAFFPDATSINNALRALIGIIPQKQRKMHTQNHVV
jgi:hypothetical protein